MILLWQNSRLPRRPRCASRCLAEARSPGWCFSTSGAASSRAWKSSRWPAAPVPLAVARWRANSASRMWLGGAVWAGAGPPAVVEAASHDAVREHLVALLEAGIHVVVLSVGALADDRLRHAAEDAARRSGALLYVPSGGIGGLDALKAACAAGVDEVSIEVAKPPLAWKGIAYVEAQGIDLD